MIITPTLCSRDLIEFDLQLQSTCHHWDHDSFLRSPVNVWYIEWHSRRFDVITQITTAWVSKCVIACHSRRSDNRSACFTIKLSLLLCSNQRCQKGFTYIIGMAMCTGYIWTTRHHYRIIRRYLRRSFHRHHTPRWCRTARHNKSENSWNCQLNQRRLRCTSEHTVRKERELLL